MSQTGQLAALLEDGTTNALVGWGLTGVAAVVAVESVAAGHPVWTVVALTVVALVALPPLTYRDPTVMLPWEVLFLGVLPLVGRALAVGFLSGSTAPAMVATHVSVAAVALLVAVELDVFTPVRMTNWFAVLFVVVATLAAAGVWAVVQWFSDLLLGTAFVYSSPPPVPPALRSGDPLVVLVGLAEFLKGGAELPISDAAETAAERALMWDFVAATVAGLLAGVVFEGYFRRYARGEARLPDEVREAVE